MLSKEELLKEFFIKEKNYRFNISKFSKMKNDDIRKISLINYYSNSSSIRETYIRLRNNWDEIPTCPVCGKQLKWLNSKNRFQYHCSSSCAIKDPITREKYYNTNIKKYGDKNYNNHEKQKQTMLKKYGIESALCFSEFRDKGYNTRLEKYGNKLYNNPDKITQTCKERYGSGRNTKAIQNTMIKKYGIKSYLESNEVNLLRNSKEIQNKIQKTKQQNHTFNTSKSENESYQLLKEKYPDVIYQYKSKIYPFNCDFYIPSLDLYIECNYHWTHGGKIFEGTKEDNIKLDKWKEKNTKFYNNAIKTWTIRDPNKRKIVKENNINWLEFFNINELIKWLN